MIRAASTTDSGIGRQTNEDHEEQLTAWRLEDGRATVAIVP